MAKIKATVTFTLTYESDEELGKRFVERTLESVASSLVCDETFLIGDGLGGVDASVVNELSFDLKVEKLPE